MKKEIVLRGLPTSPGIAIGQTYFLRQELKKPERRLVDPNAVESELKRLESALEKSRGGMAKTRDKAVKELGEIVGRIFDSHLLILEDVTLLDEIRELIKNDLFAADYAVYQVMRKTYNTLLTQKKDYFRERADDIRDVGTRIILNLWGKSDRSEIISEEPVILAARIITPSEIVHINRDFLIGVMTDMGGVTSHTAILTRALEVPAVVGLKKVSTFADSTSISIVNGNSGKVILNPTSERMEKYVQKRKHFYQFYFQLANLKELPAETTDGHRVKLLANIELPHEVNAADTHGAEGIGLFRTEYLYLVNNQFPSEEEQYLEYRQILERMAPRPVTIRTFDLGGDKAPAGLEIGREANPFLGLRAIRISLAKPELLETQLRAVLRASIHGTARLMFPLVTGINEFRKIKSIFRSVRKELQAAKTPFDEDIKIGIMIEVPSAVIMAPELAREVDFFSIGTNDLIQFTLAADRGNEMVADLFQDLHPAILRMVKMVVEAGDNRGIEVGMCGEMAGDPMATVILIGLGLKQLSVSPLMLPEIKKIIRTISYADAKEFAERMIILKTYKEIKQQTEKMMKQRFADLPIWFSHNGNRY